MKPGTKRVPDAAARRQVAGGPTVDDAALGVESPELRALHAAERELFPPAMPPLGSPWPLELPSPLAAPDDRPRVHASGLPPAPPPNPLPVAEGGKDLSWLAKLQMPDLPVRWDARLVRYLEFFKDDPRGHAMLSVWLRRSGRYKESIRRTLRRKGVPEDLLWLSMIESGFEPVARSPVGAVGLWQFMPETGRAYGLPQDRWADQRLNVQAATEAAADFLADLHRRFASWELAMAAYNMGYGGVLGVVRRYNSNDYWALSRLEGSFPWETTLYVPKILAAAIVAKNPAVFGFQDLALDPPLEGEDVNVAPGTPLSVVASAAGCTTKDLEALNPELRASRTPPGIAGQGSDYYAVKVPLGRAASCAQNLARGQKTSPLIERYVVRFGESLDQIAQARKVTVAKLVDLNGIASGEVVRGGTVLLVPKVAQAGADPQAQAAAKLPVVIVPADIFVYPDRRRVFYRVTTGDTLRDIGAEFKVTIDELRRWNDIDPSARLQEGMTLQLFVPEGTDLSRTVVLGESEVHPVPVGSDEFFVHWEEKGRKRVQVTAKAGDTLETIGRRYNVTASLMERINRRGRSEPLREGETLFVYASQAAAQSQLAEKTAPEPAPLGALPALR